jgi:hypothetical protein
MIIDRRSLLPLERSSSLLGLGGGAMDTSGDAGGCNTLELPLSFHNASSGGTPEGPWRLFLDDARLTATPIASPSAESGGSAATVDHLRGLASAEGHTLPNDGQEVMVTTAADPDRHLILIVEARAGSARGEFMALVHVERLLNKSLLSALCLDALMLTPNCTIVCLRSSGFLSFPFSLEYRARPLGPLPV